MSTPLEQHQREIQRNLAAWQSKPLLRLIYQDFYRRILQLIDPRFPQNSVSHLILMDVFHHLAAPASFFKEARRVLAPTGRVILFEPYVSWSSFPVYELLHHEPVGWRRPIDLDDTARPREYYAAQGNATRLFFLGQPRPWLPGWELFHAEAFSGFSYLLSGGYSKPAFYPARWLPRLQRVDRGLSRWPRLFGARALVGLRTSGGGS